jgi:hypothetical protein
MTTEEKARRLIDYLIVCKDTLENNAEILKERYIHLQDEKKKEKAYNEYIKRNPVDGLELSEQLAIMDRFGIGGIGGGVAMAEHVLNFDMKRTIKNLMEIHTGLEETIEYLSCTDEENKIAETDIKPDKIIEGNLESLKHISNLLGTLAAKIEAEIKADEAEKRVKPREATRGQHGRADRRGRC